MARGAVGGVLMGLANLVPGISGGTMLVAVGVYQRFINAIAEMSTLRFRLPSLLLLGSVVLAALLAILLLAGPVKGLVVDYRWIMYSLFIGLTLGGVPVVWGMVDRATPGLWIGALCGVIGMAALGLAQALGSADTGDNSGLLMMFLAGVAGASAMILPGVSGGYLLLILGVYVPILAAIDQLKWALGELKGAGFTPFWEAASEPVLQVVIPVGVGVVIGVVAVSNLLKLLLERAEKPTLGVLLGLLVGAVVGLWPFQQGVPPEIGETFKGAVVTAESLAELSPDDYPTLFFTPTVGHIGGALALILAGFGATSLVARLGREKA